MTKAIISSQELKKQIFLGVFIAWIFFSIDLMGNLVVNVIKPDVILPFTSLIKFAVVSMTVFFSMAVVTKGTPEEKKSIGALACTNGWLSMVMGALLILTKIFFPDKFNSTWAVWGIILLVLGAIYIIFTLRRMKSP